MRITIPKKVKENSKTAWYLGVIVFGITVTCVMFYSVLKELFSSNSPNSVYSKAVKRIKKDHNVVAALGEPITSYGEETRRGRRQHVAHSVFVDTKGKQYMIMKFYVKGIRQSGTVHLAVQQNESGDYEYKYFYIELNDFKRTILLIEDNRKMENEHELENNFS